MKTQDGWEGEGVPAGDRRGIRRRQQLQRVVDSGEDPADRGAKGTDGGNSDDGDQGITDVVRGEDLADNTPRQIALQRALGLATPVYFHTPLVMGENGEKLSKQNGAKALTLDNPAQVMNALNQAAITLGLQTQPGEDLPAALAAWVRHWQTLTPA